MSRNGNCWDNAWVERFFGTLKRERVSPRHEATRDDAKREIVEYREVVSSRPHRHSTLGDHSPAEYAARTTVRNQVSTESGKGQIYPGCLRAVHPNETDTVKKNALTEWSPWPGGSRPPIEVYRDVDRINPHNIGSAPSMSGKPNLWRNCRTRAIGGTTSGRAGVLRTPAQSATQDKETGSGSGSSTTGSEPAPERA